MTNSPESPEIYLPFSFFFFPFSVAMVPIRLSFWKWHILTHQVLKYILKYQVAVSNIVDKMQVLEITYKSMNNVK